MTFTKWELKKGENFKTAKSGIPTKDLDFITKYALWREQAQQFEGDDQSPNAFFTYNDSCMQYLHSVLYPVLEKETGLKLLPTYSYMRVYRNGATLDKHTDRPACEISASLHVGSNYSPTWKLYAEGQPITQEIGDLLIYRGCEVEHWREPFVTDENNYHVQLFVHFVDSEGPYEMCSNDEEKIE
mgnify:CR=1 FL=1